MNLQIISDAHMEMSGNMPIISVSGNILAMLGDMADPFDDETTRGYKHFLDYYSQLYEIIFIVLGNHEFYNRDYNKTINRVENLCSKYKNVFLLNRSSYLIHNIRILGCTLWSNIPKEYEHKICASLRDYKCIHEGDDDNNNDLITSKNTNAWHKQDLDWLTQEIYAAENRNEQIIVLTHHAPLFTGVSAPYTEDSFLKYGFCTDLKDLIAGRVKLCCSGHTHWNYLQIINGTIFYSNQVGYHNEKIKYKAQTTLKIDTTGSIIQFESL